MKKEDVVSAGIMTIVSMLVLIGFTVAWFTRPGVGVSGMHLQAAEKYDIIVALTPGGKDISTLGEGRYVDMDLKEMTNVETGKLAPGQFGKITFYVRPTDVGIRHCYVRPQVWISQSAAGGIYEWYPGEGEVISLAEGEVLQLEELYEIVGRHVQFFEDEGMTKLIPPEGVLVEWEEAEANAKAEKEINLYWKWHYEYPFSQYYTEEELEQLDAENKKNEIDTYDSEDTQIGNNVTAMRFHFAFSAQ